MDGGQGKGSAGGKLFSVAALDKRLGVRRRAREQGARNHPSHDVGELSEVEQEIFKALVDERARLDAERRDSKAEAERRLRALAPTPEDFVTPALSARLALKQAAGRLAHDWAEAGARAREAREDLLAFKRDHGLRRAARYPGSPLLQAGMLFAAALFEALFSAALFAEDDERGLLGGAIVAAGLSGANVALGFLAGFLGLRYIQHVRWLQRSAGAAAFAAFALLALMLNLFAADWRDRVAAASGALPDRGSDASFQLWSLLQLQSPQAIILLMLGAGVWVFAALKGYSGVDDPYPDFGKMSRAAEDASEALAELRSDGRAELEQPLEQARAALTERLDKMRLELDAMSKAFDAAALQMEELDARGRALDDTAGAAVQLYRQENVAARSGPAPDYFGQPPPLIGAAPDALGPSAALLDEARGALKLAQVQAAKALEELHAELEAATQALDQAGP